MKFAGNWLNEGPAGCRRTQETMLQAALAAAILLVLIFCSCTSTVRPKVVESKAPSWDGNAQNSGLIGFDANGNAIITPRAEARYFYLCELYGWKFHPPACGAETILTSSNTFLLDPQHLSEFATMNRWLKEAPGGAANAPGGAK